MSTLKNKNLVSLPDLLENAGVQRAGEITLIEKGEVPAASTRGAWKYAVPLAAFDHSSELSTGAGIVLPEAPARLAEMSNQSIKAWRVGASWDVPIMQLVAWSYVHGLNAVGPNPEGLVYLGSVQDIARTILGNEGRIHQNMVRNIRYSLERLCHVSLGDLGYVDAPGDVEIAHGPLMSHVGKYEDEMVVRVGALYQPEVVQMMRDAINRKRRGKTALKAATRSTLHLVPVQSTGLLLTDHVDGSSPRTFAAQDRVYGLIHAHIADHWHRKPFARRGALLTKQQAGDIATLARIRKIGPTLRLLEQAGIVRINRDASEHGLLLSPGPSERRLRDFLKRGSDVVEAKLKKAVNPSK